VVNIAFSQWAARDARPTSETLPDLHALVGREVKLLALLDVEGRVPGVDVAHRQRPELAGRVTVGQNALAKCLVSHFCGPRLSEGDEEALVSSEAVEHRGFLAAERVLVGIVRGCQTRDIRDILAESQLAVHVQARERFILVVLSGEGLAGLLEFAPAKAFAMVGVVYGLGQLFEGFYLTPRLVGERIGLHPLAVIFMLLAFGQLFGFVGVLVALPASAVLLVAIRRARAGYFGSKLYQS